LTPPSTKSSPHERIIWERVGSIILAFSAFPFIPAPLPLEKVPVNHHRLDAAPPPPDSFLISHHLPCPNLPRTATRLKPEFKNANLPLASTILWSHPCAMHKFGNTSVETVLITGASSGIGTELAKCFAADGCQLVLVARNAQALQSLADDLHEKYKVASHVLTADLGRPEDIERIFNQLQSSGITIDVLVNNAGFGARGPFVALPLKRQLEMVQVNITALTNLTGLFLPGMIARKNGGVLNVASAAAFQPGPGMAVYFATKAFVLSFSEAIAEETIGKGVTITAFCPGSVKTNFASTASIIGRPYTSKGSATAEATACYGHRAFRRGQVVAVPGLRNKLRAFAVRLVPRRMVRWYVKSLNALDPAT
jgi:hypothetical protein